MKIIIALFSTLFAQKKVWWGKCPEVPLIANFDLDRVSFILVLVGKFSVVSVF